MNWIRSASVTVRLAVAKTDPSVISSHVRPRTRGSTSEDGTNGWVVVIGRPSGMGWGGGERALGSALRFSRELQPRLGQDVALALRRAGVDRPGARIQVAAEPRAGGAGGARVVGPVRPQRQPAGDDLCPHAGQLDGEVGGPLVVLAPVQLRDGGLGAQLSSGEVSGQHAV